jgi:hypothetical protein
MFSVNSYAKIKEVENKGSYSICKISISKKDKKTNKYDTDFVGKAKFVGQAHLQKPMVDQRIKITSCGVSNCFTKDDKLEFLKVPNYVVFLYELQDSEGSQQKSSNGFVFEEVSGDLPF